MESHSSSWSIGETRALAIKAARGSGMPWGMAEEAGYACAWLASHSLPGVTALAALLNHRCHRSNRNHTPSGLPVLTSRLNPENIRLSTALNTALTSPIDDQAALVQQQVGQAFCPVLLGTLINDGLVSNSAAPVCVAQPMLLLPFLVMAANNRRRVDETLESVPDTQAISVSLQWTLADAADACHLMASSAVEPGQCDIEVDTKLQCVAAAMCEWDLQANRQGSDEHVSERLFNHYPAAGNSPSERSRVQFDEAPGITILESYASMTYAPETEDSRNRGAGAGDEN